MELDNVIPVAPATASATSRYWKFVIVFVLAAAIVGVLFAEVAGHASEARAVLSSVEQLLRDADSINREVRPVPVMQGIENDPARLPAVG
jgi:hypothetical protein